VHGHVNRDAHRQQEKDGGAAAAEPAIVAGGNPSPARSVAKLGNTFGELVTQQRKRPVEVSR
jgi:hypothetical protein